MTCAALQDVSDLLGQRWMEVAVEAEGSQDLGSVPSPLENRFASSYVVHLSLLCLSSVKFTPKYPSINPVIASDINPSPLRVNRETLNVFHSRQHRHSSSVAVVEFDYS